MNISPSECSSGCESGWTMYLDQHSNSTYQYSKTIDKHYQRKGTYVNEEEDDYDLSMVSDASSGPPLLEDSAEKNKKSEKKKKAKEQKREEKNLYLDDTASSPLCNFSQDTLAPASIHTSVEHVSGFSQAPSAAHFQKHFGFFKSSQKEKTYSAKSGSLLGRKRQ
ncbi:unnamed protein product [Fraxinus pennsylvanica]|uniref:Uncharacterized protein n=1 Tax=Fraxinus pennsylvanica TaxID=56036 RepID=A0AAD1ZKA1_9LAMI|nr:unnamed protein product [Fraxinus pennsylvanica]